MLGRLSPYLLREVRWREGEGEVRYLDQSADAIIPRHTHVTSTDDVIPINDVTISLLTRLFRCSLVPSPLLAAIFRPAPLKMAAGSGLGTRLVSMRQLSLGLKIGNRNSSIPPNS